MNGGTGSWSAIVPFKPPGTRKTRLAARLTMPERDLLTEVLFHHVVDVLTRTRVIREIIVLSTCEVGDPRLGWIADQGRGMNLELKAAKQMLGPRDLIIVHADLPFLAPGDILDLAVQANSGSAIAPDRHLTGTNALAFAGAHPLSFTFGPDSFQRQIKIAKIPPRIVRRPGLALDIDTPEDLDLALKQGFRWTDDAGTSFF